MQLAHTVDGCVMKRHTHAFSSLAAPRVSREGLQSAHLHRSRGFRRRSLTEPTAAAQPGGGNASSCPYPAIADHSLNGSGNARGATTAGSLASGPRAMAFTGDSVLLDAGTVFARARLSRRVNASNFPCKTDGTVALHLGVGTVLPHVKDVLRVADVALVVPGQRANYRARRHRVQRFRQIVDLD